MGRGYLMMRVSTGDGALPVVGARVSVQRPDGTVLYTLVTDASGETGRVALTAPDVEYTLDPNYGRPAWSVIDVRVQAQGFVTEVIHNVEILDTQLTILPVEMHPLAQDESPDTENHIDVGPVALLIPGAHQRGPGDPPVMQTAASDIMPPAGPPAMQTAGSDDPPDDPSTARAARQILIPDYITVHLGTPSNTAARNVRVRFIDYVKVTAASEIYATWPDASLRANIYAIMTFALNRVYTEWYPLRGFPFNITNSTSYDQYYRHGGPTFDSINRIVDQILGQYARRTGVSSPYFTEYCNGTTSKCRGMSQWGTVTLANQGLNPLEILRYYYPRDLIISTSTNIGGITESFPGTALRLGSRGPDVQRMQNFLNRIRANFPLIPLIPNPNGVFDAATETAVRAYQRMFNLVSDGVIGRSTWNSISFKYLAVAKLAELNGEGTRYGIGINPPTAVLSTGSKGANVQELQFILNYIAPYTNTPTVIMDSTFGTATRNAVIE
ncbi:MAG: peptidoglycan-binding protein, partial [Clostridiales bacterium]|nr:peptidoglycan-binding protein [Clostridiales bacterium]